MGEIRPETIPNSILMATPTSLPLLPDRHAACLLLKELDYDEQLFAISGMLRRNDDHSRASVRKIEEIEAEAKHSTGGRNERIVDELIGEYYSYTYEDGARSMAAVGMLAPFIESVFYHAFQSLREIQSPASSETHKQWARPAQDQWDCRYVWERGRRRSDVVRGILQLADATQLKPHLPSDLDITLDALFAYRNSMFHNGLEWPKAERDRFSKRIAAGKWPKEWFATASIGGDPWMFYMSDAFIEHVLKTADAIIDGIGAYCNKHHLGPRASRPSDRAPTG